jgi:glucose-6-phosphate isomerase
MPDDVTRLLAGDPTAYPGPTAATSLGWLSHAKHYLGSWLDETSARLPRRHARVILLGMGGSSSPARFYAEAGGAAIDVLDTSNPDTVAATDFSESTVIASSKSGTTIETRTLLDHALASGLSPADLVVITDAGTELEALAQSLGALVVGGDPATGGRFSALSAFGLVPALYAGWSAESLRRELAGAAPSRELVISARETAAQILPEGASWAGFELAGDPLTSGGALWLEQLLAETTGKSGHGVVPLVGSSRPYRPAEITHWHLVAALCARRLGVDPFDQPDVEAAKRAAVELLGLHPSWDQPRPDPAVLRRDLERALYVTLQVFAPLESAFEVATLRTRVAARYPRATANLGPRYLHSTGQLHKGGPAGVCAVVIAVRPRSASRPVSGHPYGFHELHLAQALADHQAVLAAGRTSHLMVVEELAEASEVLGLDP